MVARFIPLQPEDDTRAALCVAACEGIPDYQLKDEGGAVKLGDVIDYLRNQVPLSGEPHPLQSVFDQCVEQAATGKGEERHGHGADFMEQPWFDLTKAFGLGGPLFQASKKLRESVQFLGTTDQDRFKKEVLGAINYAAMALIAFEMAEDESEQGGCAGCGGCEEG